MGGRWVLGAGETTVLKAAAATLATTTLTTTSLATYPSPLLSFLTPGAQHMVFLNTIHKCVCDLRRSVKYTLAV